MSEQARRRGTGGPTARNVGFSPGRAVVRRGMGADLLGSVSSGSAGSSAAAWRRGSRDSRPRRGSVLGSGRTGGTPGWYRRLAVGISATGAAGVVAVWIETRGGF